MEKMASTGPLLFIQTHRDLLTQRVTQPNPYHEANAIMDVFQEKSEEVLEQIANAVVTPDTSTISTLTEQIIF